MLILMKHPVHGATHVYTLSDQERLQGYGWQVAGEKTPEQKLDAAVAQEKSEAPRVKRKYTRRVKAE